MRLDSLNKGLGVRTPAEVFKKCLRCRSADLLDFEGEVFCLKCNWDSVVIHAEALAAAQIRKQQRKGQVVPISRASAPYIRMLMQPQEPREYVSSPELGPDVA